MMNRFSWCVSLAIAGAALSACGVEDERMAAEADSFGSTEQAVQSVRWLLPYNPDGWVTDDAVNSSEPTYNIGKIYWFLSGDSFYDAFMTFSFNDFPTTTTLVSAKLKICLREVNGDPWGNLGSLYVARVDPYYTLNTSLYYAPYYDAKVYWSSRPATANDCGSVDVTDMVRNAVNSRDFAYMRLFFPRAPKGGTHEFIKVESSRGEWLRLPQLEVIYDS